MNNNLNCKLCERTYSSMGKLSSHITRVHKDIITKEEYYNKYILTDKDNNGICKNQDCNKRTRFIGFTEGYGNYCSNKCMTNSDSVKEKRKKTTVKNFGVECPFQSEEVKYKIKKRNIELYGVDNPSKSNDIKEKKKQTFLDRYGVETSLLDGDVKEKIKKTNLKRFGFENPNSSEEIKQKKKKTCLKRYGVDNPNKLSEFKDKKIHTNLKRYGVEYVSQCEEFKEKIRQTNLEKYGCEYTFQSEEIKDKIKKTNLERYGAENPSQSEELIHKYHLKFFKKLIETNRLKNLVVPLFTEEEYEGINYNKYKFKCIKCENEFLGSLINGKIPRCCICYPINSSHAEIEILNYIKDILNEDDIIHGDRTILNGKELDIYIPSKKIAIEFNGLYWHSESFSRIDKNYHLNKTLECKSKGIQLIHIFEDEWIENKDIVKSIIRSKLGIIDNRIFARKCVIKSVESDKAKDFLNANHIQSYIRGKHLGLFYKDELVSILTYGKPRFNKNYDIEILRFCSKLNTIVIGGLSKIMKYLSNNNYNKSIISYADRRFGNGDGYLNCGFRCIGESKPSYYYVKQQYRYNRMKFQKHKLKNKLEIFDKELTEWENMQINGYDRIWDCGNFIWENK